MYDTTDYATTKLLDKICKPSYNSQRGEAKAIVYVDTIYICRVGRAATFPACRRNRRGTFVSYGWSIYV